MTDKPRCPRCRADRKLIGGDPQAAHTLGKGYALLGAVKRPG